MVSIFGVAIPPIPPFPTYTYSVSLPGWLGGAQLFSVVLPNILGIPLWLLQITMWTISLPFLVIGAIIEKITGIGASTLNSLLSWALGLMGSFLNTLETAFKPLGIFEPVES